MMLGKLCITKQDIKTFSLRKLVVYTVGFEGNGGVKRKGTRDSVEIQ